MTSYVHIVISLNWANYVFHGRIAILCDIGLYAASNIFITKPKNLLLLLWLSFLMQRSFRTLISLRWAEKLRKLTFVYQTILYQIKARCAEWEWSGKLPRLCIWIHLDRTKKWTFYSFKYVLITHIILKSLKLF